MNQPLISILIPVYKEKGEIAYNIVKKENSKDLLFSTFREILF